MLELRSLDSWIARLDRAIVRAHADSQDRLAAFELCYCIEVLSLNLSPLCLPREVLAPFYRAVGSAQRLEPDRPESVVRVRSALLDVAAAISVLPWEVWSPITAPIGVLCPFYDQ
jgi:hypothetical protein